MHYVYILESEPHPGRYYVGETADLRERLKQHNAGKSVHTARFQPWNLVWYAAFQNRPAARRFETYLKSASGRAFQKERLA